MKGRQWEVVWDYPTEDTHAAIVFASSMKEAYHRARKRMKTRCRIYGLDDSFFNENIPSKIIPYFTESEEIEVPFHYDGSA